MRPFRGRSAARRDAVRVHARRVARTKLAELGVTVNGLLAGWFDTDRVRTTAAAGGQRAGITAEAFIEARKQLVPARRLGTIEELGATARSSAASSRR